MLTASCAFDHGDPQSQRAPKLERIRGDAPAVALGADAIASMQAYISNRPELVAGLSTADEFNVRQRLVAIDGMRHVRFEQTHDGIRVWGADVVVHTSGPAIRGMSGTVAIDLGGVSTRTQITADDALDIAKAAYAAGAQDPNARLRYSRNQSELVIYPTSDHTFRTAWHVVFYTDIQAGIRPGLWNTFVDADTGKIIGAFNAIDTAVVQGSGPGGNAKTPRTWTDQLDVVASGGQYAMNTDRLLTVNLNHGTSGGTVVTGPLDSVGDAAEDDAHGFAEGTLNVLKDWYGLNSIDDKGMVIRSQVHYSSNYENAFWDGTQMSYGDGASYFYPLSGAADVVGHEINHGFTEHHSALNYSGMSGGMNESFSDVAGTILEFYMEGDNGDFLLGEEIIKSTDPTAALRYMCDPTKDGASIDNAADYYNGLDVHYSSGVFNKAFCLSARRLATGSPTGQATQASVRRAGEAWYLANEAYWTSGSNFMDGCQGVIDAAKSLGFSADEVTALSSSFADVGVNCDSTTPTCGDNVCNGTETCSSCPSDCGTCNTCGDGTCSSGEDCQSCPSDCGTCNTCGDGTCSSGEDCQSCPSDCGTCSSCGDGTCDSGESCQSCPSDCGTCSACAHDKCATGGVLDATCDQCVSDICAADAYCCNTAWDSICVGEVSSVCGETCGSQSTCGDGTCDSNESCSTCPADCGTCATCAHDLCSTGGVLDATCDQCVGDICAADSYCCNTAWDNICVGEVSSICGQTCGSQSTCGDGTCDSSESCSSCPADCGTCSTCAHDKCTGGGVLDPSCDQCVSDICAADAYCCKTKWDSICVGEVSSICKQTCP